MAVENLTLARLREIVSYDPETGVFKRIKFASPLERGKLGVPIGSNAGRGYLAIGIDRRVYGSHRLAWFYVHGRWPASVDHINGDRSDNRIANLREATKGENRQNLRRAMKASTTGLLGVYFDSDGKYRARITLHGKATNLGRFDKADDAHAAYLKAKREMHPFCTI